MGEDREKGTNPREILASVSIRLARLARVVGTMIRTGERRGGGPAWSVRLRLRLGLRFLRVSFFVYASVREASARKADTFCYQNHTMHTTCTCCERLEPT